LRTDRTLWPNSSLMPQIALRTERTLWSNRSLGSQVASRTGSILHRASAQQQARHYQSQKHDSSIHL
jgi:hypothetical protein